MDLVPRPVIRYHGGKYRLAPWILRFFPPHHVYTEAFGGAASVLLQKRRSHGEVYNDLDGDVVNLFRVLRDQNRSAELARACSLTPYSRAEFDIAWDSSDDPVERARRTVIRAQMGFASSGATKGVTGFRIDSKRAYKTAQQLWAEYPTTLAAVTARLQGVLIENRPAVDVLRQHDGPGTLHYIDPPYMPGTRCRRASSAYRHEMTEDQHAELLCTVKGLRGMVVLSGYDSLLYTQALADWDVRRTKSMASGGRGTVMRTECVWLNPACQRMLGGLFTEEAE